ncbi:MAG: hypothetical protein K9M54_07885 [Kiritimatiellales bacterium]|nr:hypothetical protein [Kiritimatiellales bacterium]
MNRLVLMALILAGGVQAQMIVLEGVGGETLTTGDLLDGAGYAGITTNVVEIPGLQITARSGAGDQNINVTVDSLGITIFNSGDDTDAFDPGEKLVVSFNKDIRINRLDFNQFTTNESIMVSIDGIGLEIHDLELSNRTSDYLDTNLFVTANTEIEFYTTGASVVGLDGIDVTVMESASELSLSLVTSNGTQSVSASFSGIASTNYVLQYRTGLTDSNGWNTVSAPFSSNSVWNIETTNPAGFYRVIVE